MIFPKIKAEKIIQVGDKIRLDASKSFSSDEVAFTNVEIKTDSSGAYIPIASDGALYLDWVYETSGEKTVSVRINSNDSLVATTTVNVISEAEDKLFSNDSDIEALEYDIEYYYKQGRNSHLDMHREAQKHIIEELGLRGVVDSEGNPITKANILETEQLRTWSKYYTLFLIYNDHKKSSEDALAEKANHYFRMAQNASQDRQFIKIDADTNGTSEKVDSGISVVEVVRR